MGSKELLPGTLEMLILKTLSRGPNHGYGIAQHIHSVSADSLKIGEGSLYPALQRLLVNDWVRAEWGVSEHNRKARIYKLTSAGRKRLAEERRSFDSIIVAIGRVMEA
ncbi:MAG: PadR family transcriptional regulator [Bryobacteraceae bacterium]